MQIKTGTPFGNQPTFAPAAPSVKVSTHMTASSHSLAHSKKRTGAQTGQPARPDNSPSPPYLAIQPNKKQQDFESTLPHVTRLRAAFGLEKRKQATKRGMEQSEPVSAFAVGEGGGFPKTQRRGEDGRRRAVLSSAEGRRTTAEKQVHRERGEKEEKAVTWQCEWGCWAGSVAASYKASQQNPPLPLRSA